MPSPRPSWRCLWEDLADDLAGEPSALGAHVRTHRHSRTAPPISEPLDQLRHPVLIAAQALPLDDLRKRIAAGLALPNTHGFSLGGFPKAGRGAPGVKRWGTRWIKVRSGDLRGLGCFHADQFWLGWEGPRSTDYAPFNERKDRDRSTAHFEPTDDDIDRLRLEQAWQSEHRRRVERCCWFLDHILDSWDAGQPSASRHADGDELRVDAYDENGLGSVEIVVDRCAKEQFEEILVAAVDSLPGTGASEWEPDLEDIPRGFALYAIVEPSYLDKLVALRRDHGTETLVSDHALVADDTAGLSHVVTTGDHIRGYAHGQLIRSICGRRFIPSADTEDRQVCPECSLHAFLVSEIRRSQSP